jgi:hypothetical protein
LEIHPILYILFQKNLFQLIPLYFF